MPDTSDPDDGSSPPPPSESEITGYTADGVPTFDHARSVIEGRSATAAGADELDRERPAVRSLDEREADRAAAGRDRLEEIRRSIRGES